MFWILTTRIEIRYPRVGDANAVVEPRILFLPSSENNLLSLSGEEDVRKNSLKSWRPQRSIYQQFPWVEYIVRGGWLADDPFQSQHNLCSSSSWKNVYFWLALLDRSQQHLAIVVFDITSDSGEGVIVWEERQPQWINVPDFVLFLDENNSELSVPIDQFTSAMKYDNSIEFDYYLKSRACITCPQQHIDSKHMANIPKNITFLIVSEVDGYAHLYYSQLRLERQDTCLECHLFYQPLTNVANKDEDPHSLLLVTTVKHIDYCKGHIYFIGICKSGLEKHLYVWKQSGVILRLTDGVGRLSFLYWRIF